MGGDAKCGYISVLDTSDDDPFHMDRQGSNSHISAARAASGIALGVVPSLCPWDVDEGDEKLERLNNFRFKREDIGAT